MPDNEKLSRQKRSAKKRNNAGLAQVKVYLDKATLELLELIQKDMSDRDIKRDELNMFRSMAVTASIHSLAQERLREQLVEGIVGVHTGTDCPSGESSANPHKYLLRTMINHFYRFSKRTMHRRRLADVAKMMNETSFRKPGATTKGWTETDISSYVSNDIRLEK